MQSPPYGVANDAEENSEEESCADRHGTEADAARIHIERGNTHSDRRSGRCSVSLHPQNRNTLDRVQAAVQIELAVSISALQAQPGSCREDFRGYLTVMATRELEVQGAFNQEFINLVHRTANVTSIGNERYEAHDPATGMRVQFQLPDSVKGVFMAGSLTPHVLKLAGR